MPSTEDKTEWQVASHYLEEQKNKSASNKILLKLYRKDSFHHEPDDPSTTYSYLQFKDSLFRLAPGEKKPNGSIAGEGAFSRVKYLYDRAGIRYTVKIDKETYAESAAAKRSNEGRIALDLGFFKMIGYRKKPWSLFKDRMSEKIYRYAVMDDLGESLSSFLKKNKASLSDNKRLDIAFQTCFCIHQLHQGHLSQKSHKGVAHLDIKPANLYYDALTETVHLGDFGLSEYEIDSTPQNPKGTPNYLPYRSKNPRSNPEFKRWNKAALDLFALKRTCYFPTSRWCMSLSRRLRRREETITMILTDEIIDKYELYSYFKTTDHTEMAYTPLLLAAICLLAIINQTELIPKLEENVTLQEAIIVLHFADYLDEAHLKLILKDSKQAAFLALFINQLESLPYDKIKRMQLPDRRITRSMTRGG